MWSAAEYSNINSNQIISTLKLLNKINLNLNDFQDINFLDLGCGSGEILIYMMLKNAKVTGVDISESMLKYTAKQLSKLNNDYILVCSDLTQFDFNNQEYDLINCSWVLHWVNKIDCLLENICKSLKSGGYFILQWNYTAPLNEIDKQFNILKNFATKTKYEALKLPFVNIYRHPIDKIIKILQNNKLEIIYYEKYYSNAEYIHRFIKNLPIVTSNPNLLNDFRINLSACLKKFKAEVPNCSGLIACKS